MFLQSYVFLIGLIIFFIANAQDSINYTKKKLKKRNFDKLDFFINSAFIRSWKKSFNTTSNTSRGDFIKFVIADVYLIIILSIYALIIESYPYYSSSRYGVENVVAVPLIMFYLIASHFPRICIYLRRLRVNRRADGNVVWMFLPVVGWFVSWFYGSEFGTEGQKIVVRKVNTNLESKLASIKELYEKGLIDNDEYKKKKSQILNDL